MKKINFYIAFVLSILVFQSCETEEIGENSQSKTINDQAQPTGIYAMSIENGVSKKCNNNILVFPDLETFRQTAQQLNDEWEAAIDAVNTGIDPKMSDKDYKTYLEAVGFNENQPYIDFEEAYQFCSLRKDILEKEMVWLSQQGEGKWDAAKDPDNHYIWDEERPLLNPQSEVIIKDSIGNDIIYKFFEGGWIEIRNDDYAELREFNLNVLPSNPDNSKYHPYDPPIAYDPSEPWDDYPGYPPTTDNGCKGEDRHVKYFKPENKKRIKVMVKFKPETLTGNAKVKAKTKHYNRTFVIFGEEIWTPGPSLISAKLHAINAVLCNENGDTPLPKIETKRATKVKAEWNKRNAGLFRDPEITNENVYGTHKRYDYTKIMDAYDGDVQ